MHEGHGQDDDENNMHVLLPINQVDAFESLKSLATLVTMPYLGNEK